MGHLAAVLVGHSKRFPGKHLEYISKKKRLIDIVVENLKKLGFEVIIYSKYPFSAPAPIILDEEDWILPSIISLLKKLNRGIFIFGGDMPLIRKDAVEIMMKNLSHNIVIPRWKNGYLEPLHSYYKPAAIKALEKGLEIDTPSLHGAIKMCQDVYYLKAEGMDPLTFFNVNEPQDVQTLKEILRNTKIF